MAVPCLLSGAAGVSLLACRPEPCSALRSSSEGQGMLSKQISETQVYLFMLYPDLPSHVFGISSALPCPLLPSRFGLSLADRCGVPGTGPLMPHVWPRRGIAATPVLHEGYIKPPLYPTRGRH